MDWHVIGSIIGSAAMGLLGYLYKDLKQDISMLKQQVQARPQEAQVRQLIDDKLDPLKEDMQEVRISVNKLLDIALQNQKNDK